MKDSKVQIDFYNTYSENQATKMSAAHLETLAKNLFITFFSSGFFHHSLTCCYNPSKTQCLITLFCIFVYEIIFSHIPIKTFVLVFLACFTIQYIFFSIRFYCNIYTTFSCDICRLQGLGCAHSEVGHFSDHNDPKQGDQKLNSKYKALKCNNNFTVHLG